MVRNSRHLVFLQKHIINQVKHSNTYYIIGVRMQVPIKKSRVHIWYELMFKAVLRSNKMQSRDQVISSPEVLSSRVTSTFRFLKVLDIPSCMNDCSCTTRRANALRGGNICWHHPKKSLPGIFLLIYETHHQ